MSARTPQDGPPCRTAPRRRASAVWGITFACLLASSTAARAAIIFDIDDFANPPWSLTYYDGFTGVVGATAPWPAEMGWQGDRIDIAFELPDPPADAACYRFRMTIWQQFDQEFDLTIHAGPALEELSLVHAEYVDRPRLLVATIPVDRFVPGQTNWLRIQGVDVQVGSGEPPGIRWHRWLLSRVDLADDLDTVRTGQLQRAAWYLTNAILPNGLVRDSLPLDPGDPPFHPATPDAAGFALLGLCAADRLGLCADAAGQAAAILSAYAGHTAGVAPQRTVDGHWVHFMDIDTGAYAGGGWDATYSTIGSALLVSGALFAKNHFITNPMIAALADELYETTDFNAAIHPSLDGRVYLGMAPGGGGVPGELVPWNEYMLVVTLALREPDNGRALATAPFWLDADNVPLVYYREIPTITDSPGSFAPAFWVHQQHFFNADFASNPGFAGYFASHRAADALYSAMEGDQDFRYGLTAGVDPSGYFADRMFAHHGVFAPEAVAAWGDLATLLEFVAAQPPWSDPRFRFGLTRVSAADPEWVPYDAGLVDHLFLMFGLVESLEPHFFKLRQPFQTDDDADGRADAYDNCPAAWNPAQDDMDGDGLGDACDCGAVWADADTDGDVDLRDFAALQTCPTQSTMTERCTCLDTDDDGAIGAVDLFAFTDCLAASGPDTPADPDCGS